MRPPSSFRHQHGEGTNGQEDTRYRHIRPQGTTNNPERREREHRADGKDFDRLNVTSRRMTSEGAKAKEVENLARYRKGHGGRNPQYNDDAQR